MRQLEVVRETDATRLNEVVNDPAVRPYVRGEDKETPLDLTAFVEDKKNVVLLSPDGLGGCAFEWMQPGVYEVHTQMKREMRGVQGVRLVQDALWWMFTRSDAVELNTRVPSSNPAALGLVRVVGGEREFTRREEGEEVDFYSLSIAKWARRNEALTSCGVAFACELEESARANEHAEWSAGLEPADAQALGAASEMLLNSQPGKAIAWWNKYATFARLPQWRVVNTQPVLLELLGLYVWLRDDSTWEVMPLQ